MLLLAGIGNQGNKYHSNRHNIGFMAIDSICESVRTSSMKDKHHGQFISHNISGQKVGLFKTGKYMNECGHSLARIISFYKINPDNLVVFHDDLDLNPGQVKVKKNGGNAGHNGLRSIDAQLGTSEYWRIRLGIGHPRDLVQRTDSENPRLSAAAPDVSSYVLGDFNRQERQWLVPLLKAVADNVDYLAHKEFDKFQNNLNIALQKD